LHHPADLVKMRHMTMAGLHERIHEVVGDRSYRAIGDLTSHHPETIRRYLSGQAPGIEFLAALCHKLDVSADWLLTGRGPMRASDARAEALRAPSEHDRLAAIVSTLEALAGRLDRIESIVEAVESRLTMRGVNRANRFRPSLDALEAKRPGKIDGVPHAAGAAHDEPVAADRRAG